MLGIAIGFTLGAMGCIYVLGVWTHMSRVHANHEAHYKRDLTVMPVVDWVVYVLCSALVLLVYCAYLWAVFSLGVVVQHMVR